MGELKSTDGRAARGKRTRQQIIDAFVALCGEGNLIPTAQQVAERANVGLRTVFRQFNEMETLFVEIDEQLKSEHAFRFEALLPGGSLDERIARLISVRVDAFEHISPFIHSMLCQTWRYPAMEASYKRFVDKLNSDLVSCIPELQTATRTRLAAADLTCSFECYNRLRRTGHSKKETGHVMELLLRGAITEHLTDNG